MMNQTGSQEAGGKPVRRLPRALTEPGIPLRCPPRMRPALLHGGRLTGCGAAKAPQREQALEDGRSEWRMTYWRYVVVPCGVIAKRPALKVR